MAHKAAIRILPDNGDCKSVRATLGVTRAYHRQESETSGDQYRLGEGAKEGVKESDLEVSVFKEVGLSLKAASLVPLMGGQRVGP